MSKTGSGPPPLPPDLPLAPTPSPTDEGEALSVEFVDGGAEQFRRGPALVQCGSGRALQSI